MSKLDDMLHSVGLHDLARPKEHPTEDTSLEQSTPIDTAMVPLRPSPRILTGPRGRDAGGWPKVIPAGLPPAMFGEVQRLQVPKEDRRPRLPDNSVEYLSIAGSNVVNTVLLDEGVGFPIGTVQVDNYTSIWIWVEPVRRFIPPTTMAWQFPIFKKASQIRVIALSPPTIAQPNFTAGGVFYLWAYEKRIGVASAGTVA